MDAAAQHCCFAYTAAILRTGVYQCGSRESDRTIQQLRTSTQSQSSLRPFASGFPAAWDGLNTDVPIPRHSTNNCRCVRLEHLRHKQLSIEQLRVKQLRDSNGLACQRTSTAICGTFRACIYLWNVWIYQRVRGYTYLDVNANRLNETPGTPDWLLSRPPAQHPWPDMQPTHFQSHKSLLSTMTQDLCKADPPQLPNASPTYLRQQASVRSSKQFLNTSARPIRVNWRRVTGCKNSHSRRTRRFSRSISRKGQFSEESHVAAWPHEDVPFCTILSLKRLAALFRTASHQHNGSCTPAHLTNFHDS